jgi:galactose mutarotase-like enzyme
VSFDFPDTSQLPIENITIGGSDAIPLKNENGVEMCVTNYGAKVVSLFVPDKDNNFVDIVLPNNGIALGNDNISNAPSHKNTKESQFI